MKTLKSEQRRQSTSQLLTVEIVRACVSIALLLLLTSYQLFNKNYIAGSFYIKIYLLLFIGFSLRLSSVIFFEKLRQSNWLISATFFTDIVLLSLLLSVVGVEQSFLLFIYLVYILLYGLLFKRVGGVLVAMLCSLALSLVLALETSLQSSSLYMMLIVYNIAFFLFAYLSGFLSEHFEVLGTRLNQNKKDFRILKSLNDLILKNIRSGLIVTDTKYKVISTNPKVDSILDINGQSILGKTLKEVSANLFEAVELSFKSGYQEEVIESNKCIQVVTSPFLDARKEDQGFIILINDVTSLKAMQNRIQQSEKLAAIGQLAAGIAHEIRNPLASISGSVELLKVEDSKSESGQKLMSIAVKEIMRLDRLITEFLGYASPDKFDMKRVNLGTLVSEVVESIKVNPKYSMQKIDLDLEEEIIIRGDSYKLKQVYLNLLINACQAQEKSTDAIHVSCTIEDNKAITSVIDHGCGIGEAQLNKIFEPFHTTKPKGTGLGLAVVHSIIEGHGGEITVESEVGKGTVFRTRFPLNM